MDEILKKLSSYNIFNYLLPGILFALVTSKVTDFPIVQDDLLLGLFLYYFAGLVVSRFGSLVIEPMLLKVGFLKLVKYEDFVNASSKETLILELSEASNMYRTLCALTVCIAAAVVYSELGKSFQVVDKFGPPVLLFVLFLLFLFSYRKQSSYIRRRVKVCTDE